MKGNAAAWEYGKAWLEFEGILVEDKLHFSNKKKAEHLRIDEYNDNTTSTTLTRSPRVECTDMPP